MEFTRKEVECLKAVMINNFQEADEDTSILGPVWSNCLISDGYCDKTILNDNNVSGVVSSLCKKGILETDGEAVQLTAMGVKNKQVKDILDSNR